MHLVAVQLGVDGVAAAAEVDEVQQREVLLERLGGDREALDQLVRPGSPRRAPRRRPRAGRRAATAAPRSARARPGRPGRSAAPSCPGRAARRRARRRALVRAARRADAFGDESAQRGGLERHGAAVLAEDPAREQRQRRVLGDEHAVLDPVARLGVLALDPPGRVRGDLDPRLAGDVAELPVGAAAELLDVEALGNRGSRARGESRSGCPSGYARRGSSSRPSSSRSSPITYHVPFSGSSA